MSTNSCLEILAQINMGIRNNNLLIQSKIDNPYSICNGEIISVSNLLTQLNKALENLENERLEYNKKITDTKPIIKRLTEINNLIAYLDIREVLEAFSTFQYKKGIEEVSTDRSILAILPEKEYQSYFENLMYRLILNNGSHRLDQTRSMSDMNFFTVISDSEKKRTAKEILCFIYLLNEKHVLAHLDGCSNVQSNLSKWCNDVKNKVGA